MKLQLQPDSATKTCCHYRIDYFHITDINHEGDTDSQTQTVKGTLCFHSVHNTGIPGIVEVCESSCYCKPCFLSVPGECKNHRLVNNFAWVSVYKKPYISGYFKNKLWNGFSLPYKPIRNILKKKVSSKTSQISKTEMKSKQQELNSSITYDKILNTKEKRLIHVFLESTDVSKNESCDSDYEDNIPLSDYIEIMKNISERSPISFRTRTQLKEKPWVPASSRREVFDLEDYENTPDEGDGVFEIESTIRSGTRTKSCVAMNVTQD